MKNLMLVVLGSVLLCLNILSFTLNAEIYKWTDKDGKIHYSDRPNQKATTVDIKTQTQPQANQADRWQAIQERQQRYLEYLQDERGDRDEEKQKKEQQLAERKKICQEATDYHKQLNTVRMWYDEDEEGNKRYLDHTEKDKEIAKAKQMMDKYCAN